VHRRLATLHEAGWLGAESTGSRHLIGRGHARAPVLMLFHDLYVCVINAATGDLIREMVIDPTRGYQPPGPQPKTPRT
jgi:hypothetical protein